MTTFYKTPGILALILGLIFISCSSDKENDEPSIHYPDEDIELYLNIVDSQGNNLLDDKNPNNILSQDINLIFRGRKYPLMTIEDIYEKYVVTSDNPLDGFLGLCYLTEPNEDYPITKPIILAGKFPLPVWTNLKFEISWGDGTPNDYFEMSRAPFGMNDNKQRYLLTVRWNGEVYRDTQEFTIVKK